MPAGGGSWANCPAEEMGRGRKPEPVYPLLVNTLEPLVYFNPAASDNLRAIRDLMKTVAREAGAADLAAVESEIKKLDLAIDELVYELYGLTEEEKRIVEDAAGTGTEGVLTCIPHISRVERATRPSRRATGPAESRM